MTAVTTRYIIIRTLSNSLTTMSTSGANKIFFLKKHDVYYFKFIRYICNDKQIILYSIKNENIHFTCMYKYKVYRYC